MKISVVIAAKNEEDHLPDAIRSASFSNDVLIIDDYSADKTAFVAKENGARVLQRKLDGFAKQKNFGIDNAKNDWILILDADERVSPELAKSIESLKDDGKFVAFSIPFKNFLGRKWLKHGGLYPDLHTRLINKRFARYGDREVHEMFEIEGQTGVLAGDIIHLTYANYGEYLAKVQKYALLESKYSSKKPSIKHIAWVFIDKYIKLQGFKDGFAGLMSALFLAYYQYLIRRHVK